MRIGIPTWQSMVSPVLDVARHVLLADVEGGVEQRRRIELLAETGVLARAARLRDLSVDVLICGAVSWPLRQVLVSSGIRVFPHVCGNTNEVLGAYLSGHLRDRAFVMPGCGGRRVQHRRGRGGPKGFGPRGGRP